MDRDHRHRHGSSKSGKSEQRKSSKATVKEKEFVYFSNRFSREKISRAAVIPGSGFKEFIENNRPFMRKGVWEKKITPRSNSQHDSPRPSLDSRLKQYDHQNMRYDEHQNDHQNTRYDEHQRRGSLDTRVRDFEEAGRRISTGNVEVPEPRNIDNRHGRDDRYHPGDNREEVPMDLGDSDEEQKPTPISDNGFNGRERHASREINHNYKERYNLNLEPMPVMKTENIKQEDDYANIHNSQDSWSSRIGQLENFTYDRSIIPQRPNNEIRESFSGRSHEKRQNSPNRYRDLERPNHEFNENLSRSQDSRGISPRSYDSRGISPRSQDSRGISPRFDSRGMSPRRSQDSRVVSPRSQDSRAVSPRRSRDSRGISPRRSRDSRGISPRRSHDSRESSPRRSREPEAVQISDPNHVPMPPEKVVRNMNEAIPMAWHCQIYLSGLKCHKGDFCDKLHMYPRENGVVCIDFTSGQCNRKAEDCWFQHPGHEVVSEKEPDESAPVVVQSMGGLLKYIKKEVSSEPNKYKSKELPKKDSPKRGRTGNANMVPLGSRKEKGSRKENPNMVPLGSRNETDNYSPLQPRKGISTSLSYGSNSSQPESSSILSPRLKSSNNLSYASKSPLERNNSRPSTSTEKVFSNSISQERDLSKTKNNFVNNHSTTNNEGDDGHMNHKQKKRKRDNTEEIDTEHSNKDKKQKKNDERSEAGVSGNSSRSDKKKGKEEKKEDKKGLKKAIDKLLDKATTGGWERSSDRESDIIALLEETNVPIYKKGNEYKNSEINFRQLFLKFAKVDDQLKDHALWFRKSFPDFSNLPKEHHNDMTCCMEKD